MISWVSLNPQKSNGHGKDVAKHSGASIHGSYKAKVFDFKMSSGSLYSLI